MKVKLLKNIIHDDITDHILAFTFLEYQSVYSKFLSNVTYKKKCIWNWVQDIEMGISTNSVESSSFP